MSDGVLLGAPLLLTLELAVLYAAGSYAVGRLMGVFGFGGRGGVLGRLAFYVLVFPGVVLHEGAHYLACLLTGTKVLEFALFSPRRSVGDRIVLGYVRHERRAFPVSAIIGFAPVLSNPFGILLVTSLLTPLTFGEVANPTFGVLKEGILASGFLADNPLLAAAWAYLSMSFALGSVPSREDLSSLPLVLLILGGGFLAIGVFEAGSAHAPYAATHYLSTLAAGLYALPAVVAAVAAVLSSLWIRMVRF
jgi:hypothetical protein